MEISALSTAQAAQELSVNSRRVRQLVDAGRLDAQKIGGRLLVDRGSVRRLRDAHREPGRALAPKNAWGLLRLASGEPLRGVDAKSRSRIERYLDDSGDVARVAHRLSRRGEAHFLRGHPRDVAAIASDDRLVLSGASATDHHGFDLVAPGGVEAYVGPALFDDIRRRFFLEPDSVAPNVILRVVSPAVWNEISGERYAPAAAAAIDLLESRNERSRRAGREYLLGLGSDHAAR